jgi:hypothetical protein
MSALCLQLLGIYILLSYWLRYDTPLLGRRKRFKNGHFNEIQIAPALSVASPRPEPPSIVSGAQNEEDFARGCRGFSQSIQLILDR